MDQDTETLTPEEWHAVLILGGCIKASASPTCTRDIPSYLCDMEASDAKSGDVFGLRVIRIVQEAWNPRTENTRRIWALAHAEAMKSVTDQLNRSALVRTETRKPTAAWRAEFEQISRHVFNLRALAEKGTK